MIETRIKVIQPNNDISKDVYFEDKTKWTFTESNAQLINDSSIGNKDLILKTGIKSLSNYAQAVANGVVLDITKTYIIQMKVNAKNINVGRFTIAGVDFTTWPVGKEVTRKFKPTSTSLSFRLECIKASSSTGFGTSLANDNITIDYFKIIEYDVSYLDLLKTEPVLYQSNVKDIYEPDKIKSDYTKDFDIPGTPNNNIFFNHWYKISAKGDFDAGSKTPVVIQRKETDLIEGYMSLNSVKIDGSNIMYNVSIVAEMSNIWNDIDTLMLSDLDLSEYNHELNMKKMYVDLPQNGAVSSPSSLNPGATNIVWTYDSMFYKDCVGSLLTLPNGTTRLKLTSTAHGYAEGDFIESLNSHAVVEGVFDANNFYVNLECATPVPANVLFQTRKKNYTGNGWFYGVVNRGHTTKNEMYPTKSRPSLFIKGIIDKIFKEANYQYESEFLNTNYFKSLCVDILTKELTQTSEQLGDQTCDLNNTYIGNINPQDDTVTPALFLKYTKAVPSSPSPFVKQVQSDATVAYGSTFTYDIIFENSISDPNLLYSNGKFYPKYNGEYEFDINLTAGISVQNPVPLYQYILPKGQFFKKTSHWYGFDNDLDGTPSSGNYVDNKAEPAIDGDSGMVFKLQILDSKDKVIWTSAKNLATFAVRALDGYLYKDAVRDIKQKVALPLKKGESYKVRLHYERNQKYLFGQENSSSNKWRYAVDTYSPGIGSPWYTHEKAPGTLGNYCWSVFLVGNGQTFNVRESSIEDPVPKTGLNYCKFSLLQAVAEGSDIFVKHFIAEMEQKDFLSAVNKMFNLYWYWDRNKRKYIIEPFYNFYKQTELDWTSKVDLKKDIEMKPLDNDKKYILKYKDSGDYYNKDYRDAFGSGYGDATIVNSSEVALNENKIECAFSLGVLVGFPKKPYNKMVMPTYTGAGLSTSNNDNAENSENIRVYICGGKKYSDTPMILDDQDSTVKQLYEGKKYYNYPYIGHIDDTYAPYYDLCFANPAQFSYIASNYTTHNLYNKFWRDWFNLILNKEQKTVSYFINLNDSDIFNLDYSKRYVINKEPFRLISVSDHNLTANNIALVTFIKDFTSKQYVPKTVVNTGGTKPWEKNWGKDIEDWGGVTGKTWVYGGTDLYNPGGFDYNAVSSFTTQRHMWSSDTSVSESSSVFERGLNNGGAVNFQSINLGTYNTDYGTENFVTGNNNRVYSDNNFVSGTNNEVTTRNAVVVGNNIIATKPGVYFGDTYISPEGVIHNSTNVFSGGFGETNNYYESVNNLYKPNVIGLIKGTGSTTNKYAGVLEITNPHIQFTKITGYDMRHDRYDSNNY